MKLLNWWPFKRKRKLEVTNDGIPGPQNQALSAGGKLNHANLRGASRGIQPGMLVSVDEQFLSVPAADFSGLCSISPSGKYHLAWGQGSDIADASKESNGEVIVLADKCEVVFVSSILGPSEGAVADQGNFVIASEPLGGTTEELRSTFSAFSATGERLLQRELGALILNTGISPNGRFAVVQLANSETCDSGKLFLFDLFQRKELFAIRPDTGWTRIGYQFDTQQETVALLFEHGGEFRYSFSGEFLDQKAYFAYLACHGNAYVLLDQAQRLWTERKVCSDSDSALTVLGLALSAVNRLQEQPNGRARAYRLAGEAFESLGQFDQAIEAYENALADNPKVGLKKKLAILKSQRGER